MQTAHNGRQAPTVADATPVARVATLAGGHLPSTVGGLLRDAGGFAVNTVASAGELVGLARSGRADVVVLAPDRGDGWPVAAAERLAAELRELAPLIVVCEAAHDGEVIEQRIGGPSVTVLVLASLTPELLADAVRGAVARRPAIPSGPA